VAGDHLYVADIAGGFRVFDLTKPYKVATGKNVLGVDDTDGQFYAHGAKYALFEEGRYTYDTSAGTLPQDLLHGRRRPPAVERHGGPEPPG
jgi:hypothetical protein